MRSTRAHARCSTSARGRGELGFLDLPCGRRAARSRSPIRRAARGRRSATSSCSASAARRSDRSRCAPRSGRRGGTCSATRRGGFSRACTCSTTSTRRPSRRCLAGSSSRARCSSSTSKSGGTAETMAQYLIVRGTSDRSAGRQVRSATSSSSPIRSKGCAPSHRARRVDSRARHSAERRRAVQRADAGRAPSGGADRHRRRARCSRARRTWRSAVRRRDAAARIPAAMFAMLQWLADTQHRPDIARLMPYSDPLRDFADWFVQLWAESLGKHRSRTARASGRRRSPRSARPTSTARFSSSWRVRPTRPDLHRRRRARDRRHDSARFTPTSPSSAISADTRWASCSTSSSARRRGARAARAAEHDDHLERVDAWHVGALLHAAGASRPLRRRSSTA